MLKSIQLAPFFLGIALFISGCSNSGESGTSSQEELKPSLEESVENDNDTSTDNITGKAEKSEVIIGFSDDPNSFDPCAGYGATGPIIFSTLLEVNGNNELIHDLATGYSVSNDGLSWRFTIREDAVFTDGEKVKAADVAFTFNTTKNSGSTVDLTMLDSCTAEDEITVLFQLSRPDSTFIYTISQTGIVPEHAYGDNFGSNPIGSGPYKLVQWDRGQQFILEANENYYGQQPEIQRAIFLVQEEDARLAAARGGEVDICLTSATLAMTDIPGMSLVNVASVDNRGITMPVVPDTGEVTEDGYKIGHNVTSDLAIRKAMSYGINREQIIEEALNGFGDPAYTECDGLPWWNPETVIETDITYAMDLLDQAGWVLSDGNSIREKDGVKAQFNLMYFAGDSMRQAIALSVANQAKENLGIDIRVEGVSADETVRRMFSEPMIMGWGSYNPRTSYLLYHSSNAGRTDWYNPENFTNDKVDGYMDAAVNALGVEESLEYWKLAQWDGETGTSMVGEAPWAFYINAHHLYFVKDGLHIGDQKLHAHGASWPLVANLKQWKWN